MADTQVDLRWSGEGLQFESKHASGNHFRLDGDGRTAHSPVQALVLSLAGCMGADVVDITGKMRVVFEGLRMEVEGDRNAEPPRYLKAVRFTFFVKGLDPADEPRIERAVELSHEKYCSVLHSLRKDMSFSTRIVLE